MEPVEVHDHEVGEERGAHLDHADHEVRESDHHARDQAVLLWMPGRHAHDVALLLLERHRDRRDHVGAQVDGEDLDRLQRQRDAEDHGHQERRDFGDVRREGVGD